MRLAEEEKLRKEMSAKKAKEEAERKHQVRELLGLHDVPSTQQSTHMHTFHPCLGPRLLDAEHWICLAWAGSCIPEEGRERPD